MEKIVVSCLESRIDEDQSIYSRFLLGPFLSGHAVTVATALRRALLSEVKNIAITALHIQGVTHEFSTLVGIRESVLEVSLNFQQIILSTKTKSKSVQIGYLHVQGPAIVHANDLKLPDGIECVNPTQYIATLSTEGLLVVKFLIGEKKSFLKSNTSTLNSKKIKEAKVYSAQLSKSLLNHAEYDPPRLFRLLRNQSLPNGAIVRKTIEAESTSQFANLNRPNVRRTRATARVAGRLANITARSVNSNLNFPEAKVSEARGKVTEGTKTNFLTEPGSDSPSRELRASRQSTLFDKGKLSRPSGANQNVLPGSVAEVDSQSEPNLSLKEQNLIEPSLTKVEFLTGSGSAGGQNEAAVGAGPVDKKGSSKKIQKASLSRSESVRNEAGVGALLRSKSEKSLQPDLEQLSLALSLRESERSESARSSSSARITDSILDQLADQTSDEFNSEVCLRTIIPLDPIFTPVYQVNFGVERDDLSNQIRERVIMEVWTNGSIHPRQAINEAALSTMSIFSKLRKTFQLDSHSLALSANSTAPLASLTRGTRLHKTKSLTTGGVVNNDASESVEPLAALLSFANLNFRRTLTPEGYPELRSGNFAARITGRLANVSEAKVTLRGAKDSRAAVRGARVTEGAKKRVNFRRFALTKPSGTELDFTNSVRQKLNSFSSLGFVRSRHPVSLFLQNFGISHIRGQTFLLEQSFWLKARFFKGRTSTPLFGQPEPANRSANASDSSRCRPSNFRFAKVSERYGAIRFVDSKKLELRTVFSKREYTSENEPLSADTETKFRHTFKRTFLPSFKVVLGALSLSRSRSATNRNDVSARRESIFTSLTQPNLKQNQAGLTKASLLFKLRFCLAGAQTFTLLQSKSERNFNTAKVWPVGREFSLRESEAFKPFLGSSWCSETSCFPPPQGGKGNRSKDRAINQVSIGLGRLLLVLSKSEQKGEHGSRVQSSKTFALAKAVKAVALIRRAGTSCSRSDLLSKKVSTSKKGSSTFRLSKNRLNGRLSRVTSWPNFRPTGQTFAKPELLSLSRSESVKVTARIPQQSESRQFACSVSMIKQLKPKPILFLIKYRTFSFTRNAVRIFRSNQENSLFLLPLAKQLIRVKLARVFTSYLPLISKRSEPSIPFSFTETKAFTTVDGSNRLDVKQVLLSLAAPAASRESYGGVSQTDGRQFTRPTKEAESTLSTRNGVPVTRTEFRAPLRGQSSAVLGRRLSKKVPKSLLSKRPKKTGRRRPMGRAEGALENRAPQKRIASVIALHTITPFDRNYVPVSRFAAAKLWFRSNLKKQFGFFQFACNGFRPGHQREIVPNSRSKGLGRNRSGTRPRGLKKRWMPELGPALPRRDLERSGVCVNRTESLANLSRIGPVRSALLSRSESVESGTVPYDFTTFPLGCFAKVAKKRCFANLNFRRTLTPEGYPEGYPELRSGYPSQGGSATARVAGRLAKGSETKVLPLTMTKAPPLCLSSGLITLLSSLGPTGGCSQNVVPANNSSANFSEARVKPFQVVPQAGTDREARVAEGGNRLSILYSSNLDKMSFLSSDLANLSLSLKTYTFLKKKGKNNIATLLEYSPSTLFSLLKGDENMFHEIERCILFLGLPFKERS